MSTMHILSSQPWVERLGWTLVHFLWQGAAIAALYAPLRRRMSRANARYALGCAALISMLLAPMITWTFLQPNTQVIDPAYRISYRLVDPATVGGASHHAAAGPAPLDFVTRIAVKTQPSDFLSWVVIFWMAGVVALWLRLAGGWMVTARLRALMVRSAPEEWQRTLRAIGARIGVLRHVRLLVSDALHTPAVAGWLRPVVLIPAAALAGLPADQLEALLAHELAHVRRHDYFMNMLQSIVEALLFYHPAVWWVSRHIRAERELCCDDVAVAVGGDVLAYARALVQLESNRAVLGLGMAANGGSLSERVARLLGQSQAPAANDLGPGLIAMALLVAATFAMAQDAQDKSRVAFEVASVKPLTEPLPRMGVRTTPGGGLQAEGATLLVLIINAYQLQRFQIVGGPSWMETERYNIDAKPGAPTDRDGAFLRLRTLLADRFGLKVHRETREMPVYELLPAKGGLKLTPPKGDCIAANAPPPAQPPPAGSPLVLRCGNPLIGFSGSLEGAKMSMNDLAKGLSTIMGRPVLDHTGFTEFFDVHLEFQPEQATPGMAVPAVFALPGQPALPPPSDNSRPSIYAALQEQMGLRLATTKGPVDVLVIDDAEHPTGN